MNKKIETIIKETIYYSSEIGRKILNMTKDLKSEFIYYFNDSYIDESKDINIVSPYGNVLSGFQICKPYKDYIGVRHDDNVSEVIKTYVHELIHLICRSKCVNQHTLYEELICRVLSNDVINDIDPECYESLECILYDLMSNREYKNWTRGYFSCIDNIFINEDIILPKHEIYDNIIERKEFKLMKVG